MVHTSNTKPNEPPKLIFTLCNVRPPPPFVSRRSDRTHPPLIFVHIQRHPTPIHPLSNAKFLWKNSRNHFLTLSKLWYIIFLMLMTQILVFIAIFEKGVKFDLGAPFVHIVRHYENQGWLGAPCTLRCAIWHLWSNNRKVNSFLAWNVCHVL